MCKFVLALLLYRCIPAQYGITVIAPDDVLLRIRFLCMLMIFLLYSVLTDNILTVFATITACRLFMFSVLSSANVLDIGCLS